MAYVMNMQDDPQNDELDESQSESSDVDDNDATEISESETEKPNTGDADSNGVEEPPQSLLLGDSLTGDIEAIVASDIFIDEDLASAVLETDGSGGRVAQKSAFTEVNDKGFTIEEVIPDGFISVLSCDADVYLGSLTDDDATMLGTANEFDLDAELEDDIEDAFFPNKEFDLDAEPKEIDPDLEGLSQDELEDKEHLMPFFSLFACFILMVICAGFLISMFLG